MAAPRAWAWAQLSGQHDQIPATHNERRSGQQPGATTSTCDIQRVRRELRPEYHGQMPARRRWHQPGHRGQVPAWRRSKRPGHHDLVSAMLNERRRVVNLEPHTGARPSVRVRLLGPELARYKCQIDRSPSVDELFKGFFMNDFFCIFGSGFDSHRRIFGKLCVCVFKKSQTIR
jgi:hypothetical protein